MVESRDLNVTGRLSIQPLGVTPYTQLPWQSGVQHLLFALGMNTFRQLPQEQRVDPLVDTYSIDLSVLHPRFFMMSEVFFRRQGNTENQGAYVQIGLPIITPNFDVSARYGWRLNDDDENSSLELSMSWMIDRLHSRLMLHYERKSMAQVTLDHTLTLLGQVWFW